MEPVLSHTTSLYPVSFIPQFVLGITRLTIDVEQKRLIAANGKIIHLGERILFLSDDGRGSIEGQLVAINPGWVVVVEDNEVLHAIVLTTLLC